MDNHIKLLFILSAGVFSVKLISSDASQRCGLKEQLYTLIITSVDLQLRESDENYTLRLTWPYRFIRRYGYRAGRFTFEAGRKCTSGEGVFHLEHSNQQEIFRCISSKMKNMKKLLNDDGIISSIICDDNQFQAALSMMARSRNPIPLLTNSTTQLILDNDSLTMSCSTKPLMPEPPFLSKSKSTSPPPLKPKPLTCISKKLPTFKNEPYYESKEINSDVTYEDVLVRNDAWKTMGLNDSNYCEKPNASYTATSDDGIENYDRLQHFGFISKTAPGYRQIQPIALTSKHKPYVKATDTLIMPARKADDSHYGYGTINKTISLEKSRSNESLNSIQNNEIQYAIVLKSNKI